jgi:hypothetical protein
MNTLVFWGGIATALMMLHFGDLLDRVLAVIPLLVACFAMCCDFAAEKVIRAMKANQQATNDKE